MARATRGDGYSIVYRIGWRVEYALMHVYGPAQLDEDHDPKVEMRADRNRRKALQQERKANKRS